MLGIKKAATIEQLRFKDADKIEAQGYAIAHTEFGRGVPDGPWCRIYFHDDAHRGMHPDEGISILLDAKLGGNRMGAHGIPWATASWCAALTVRTENKAVATAVDSLIAERRQWRDGVTTRLAPVRCTEGSRKALYLFGLAPGQQPFSLGRSLRQYRIPKTPGYSTVEVKSACEQIVHSGLDVDNAPYGIGHDPEGAPFYWRDGLDLTQVHHDQLPIITYEEAGNLVDAIVTVFESHGAEWAMPPC
jgi:hypothetical protein